MVGISRRILISCITEPGLSVRSGNAIVCGISIFAYGGIEAVGGLVDKTENQKRTLPKVLFLPLLLFQSVIAGNIFMGRQHKLAAGIK